MAGLYGLLERGRFRFCGAGSGAWTERHDRPYLEVLALTPDTILVASGTSATYRSVDAGVSFTRVHDAESPIGGRIFAEDEHGVVYVGTSAAASRSTDRGATWTRAARPSVGSSWGWAVLPLPDSVAAGRVLLGGLNGVSYADVAPGDTAWALRPSSLWSPEHGYAVEAFALVAGPDGRARLLAAGIDTSRPDMHVWMSDDAGKTWSLRSRLPSPEGSNNYPAGVLAVGGASVVVGFQDGRIYRSDDAGATWALMDTLPGMGHPLRLSSLVLGPEGDRLYASVLRAGATFDDAWVYRTAPPPTRGAAEAPAASGVSLSVDPNPSSSGAAVRLALSAEADVRVSVVDVLGRTVSVLHDGRLGAGARTLVLPQLAPGVYTVRVERRDATGAAGALSRRVTILR